MENSPGRIFTALLLLAAGFTWGPGFAADAPPQPSLPLQELRLFSDIYSRIKTDYVEEVEDDKLIEGAIKGMLDVLDPYSVYLSRRHAVGALTPLAQNPTSGVSLRDSSSSRRRSSTLTATCRALRIVPPARSLSSRKSSRTASSRLINRTASLGSTSL